MAESVKVDAVMDAYPYEPHSSSVTNTLMRKMSVFALVGIFVLAILDGFVWFDANSAVVIALIPLVATLLGLPTYRNIEERKIDAQAFAAVAGRKDAP